MGFSSCSVCLPAFFGCCFVNLAFQKVYLELTFVPFGPFLVSYEIVKRVLNISHFNPYLQ